MADKPTLQKFIPATALAVIATMTLTGCKGVGIGMEGNIYEKMTIFSLIAFTFIAVIFIPFISSDSKARARYRELVRSAAALPIAAEWLTENPVYVWDSRKSFYKLLFARDGSFGESEIVTTNSLDPKSSHSGTWTITSAGALQLTREITSGTRTFTRVSQDGYHLPTLMRLSSGFAEAWFLGEHSLVEQQISCFGYPGSHPSSEKFTASLVSGLTVYWASYPPVISGSEVSVNPELAFGVLIFHPDGTLSKSINNPVEGTPDYRPSFTGTWQVDEHFGVLNVSLGLYATEVTLLLSDNRQQSLLVGTTSGNEQWFLDQERGKEELARYLAVATGLG